MNPITAPEHKLYILKEDALALIEVENHLEHKGWIIQSFETLREFVTAIFQNPPDILLISTDFKTTHLKVLISQLSLAFPFPIVGYSEESSTPASEIMTELGLHGFLRAPFTEAMMERLLLNKIEAHKSSQYNLTDAIKPNTDNFFGEKKLEQARKSIFKLVNTNDHHELSDKIVISGKPQAAPEKIYIKGGFSEPETPPLVQEQKSQPLAIDEFRKIISKNSRKTETEPVEIKKLEPISKKRKKITDPSELEEKDIDSLSNEEPLETDLYVYLAKNNKYILYTPEKSVFEVNKKNKLKKHGIDKMYLKKAK